MPMESAKYSCYSTSSLDRRGVTNRWKGPLVRSGNLYISNHAVSGLDTSCTYEPSPISSSLSMYLPPRSPTPSTSSTRSLRSSHISPSKEYKSSHFSPALSRRNAALSRSSPRSEYASHAYLSRSSTPFQPPPESASRMQLGYYSVPSPSKSNSAYARSLTADLLANGSLTNFPTSCSSRATSSYSSYGSSWRNVFRPIVLERPSLSSYVPRPKEERDKLPSRVIRRDRPLIKFVEKEELNSVQVSHLLNALASGDRLGQENAEEEKESRKRDSIRSNDSGIGSFRNSRRSRQKSGELSNDMSQEWGDPDMSFKDKEKNAGKESIASSVDEGVHLEAEELVNKSTEIMSPSYVLEKHEDSNSERTAEKGTVAALNNDISKSLPSNAIPEIAQNKRRVRINADKYVIPFNQKDGVYDENNQAVENPLKAVGSTENQSFCANSTPDNDSTLRDINFGTTYLTENRQEFSNSKVIDVKNINVMKNSSVSIRKDTERESVISCDKILSGKKRDLTTADSAHKLTEEFEASGNENLTVKDDENKVPALMKQETLNFVTEKSVAADPKQKSSVVEHLISNDKTGEKQAKAHHYIGPSADDLKPRLIKSKTGKSEASRGYTLVEEKKKELITHENAEIREGRINSGSACGEKQTVDLIPATTRVPLENKQVKSAQEQLRQITPEYLKPEPGLSTRARKNVCDPGIKVGGKKCDQELNSKTKVVWIRSKEGVGSKEKEQSHEIENSTPRKVIEDQIKADPNSKLEKGDPIRPPVPLKIEEKQSNEKESENLIRQECHLNNRKKSDAGGLVLSSQTITPSSFSLRDGRSDHSLQSMRRRSESDKRKLSTPEMMGQYGLQKSFSAGAEQITKDTADLDYSNKTNVMKCGTVRNAAAPLENENVRTKKSKLANKSRRATTTDFPTVKADENPNLLKKSHTTDFLIEKQLTNERKTGSPQISLSPAKKLDQLSGVEDVTPRAKVGKQLSETVTCKETKLLARKEPIKTPQTASPEFEKVFEAPFADNKKEPARKARKDNTIQNTTHNLQLGVSPLEDKYKKTNLQKSQTTPSQNSLDVRKLSKKKEHFDEKSSAESVSTLENRAEKDVASSAHSTTHDKLEPEEQKQEIRTFDSFQRENGAGDKTPHIFPNTSSGEKGHEGKATDDIRNEGKVISKLTLKKVEGSKEKVADKKFIPCTPALSKDGQLKTKTKSDTDDVKGKNNLLRNNIDTVNIDTKKAKFEQSTSELVKKPNIKKDILPLPAKTIPKQAVTLEKSETLNTNQSGEHKNDVGQLQMKLIASKTRSSLDNMTNADFAAEHIPSSAKLEVDSQRAISSDTDGKQDLKENAEKVTLEIKSHENDTPVEKKNSLKIQCISAPCMNLETNGALSIRDAPETLKLEESITTPSKNAEISDKIDFEDNLLPSSQQEIKQKDPDKAEKEILCLAKPDILKDITSKTSPSAENTSPNSEILFKTNVNAEQKEKCSSLANTLPAKIKCSLDSVSHDALELLGEAVLTEAQKSTNTVINLKNTSTTSEQAADSKIAPPASKVAAKKKKVKTEGEEGKPKKIKKKKIPRTSPELKEVLGENLPATVVPEISADHDENSNTLQLVKQEHLDTTKENNIWEPSQTTPRTEKKEAAEKRVALNLPPINIDNVWFDYNEVKLESPKRVLPTGYFSTTTISDFKLLTVLGRGSYGKVMLAEMKGSRQPVAIKCLKKNVVQCDKDVESTMIEREILALSSKHPFLCKLFCTFQSKSHLFFVMEYLCGGDLMFHVQHAIRFEQIRARFYAAEIICALQYLHKYGIIYRDAKLDNICLDAEGHVRLVDFGFCKLRIRRKECLPRNICGTPDYMAPEIIRGAHYNQSVDWWSFGVLLYEMLVGQSPFRGVDESELFWIICNDEVFYPKFISREATQLLTLLFERDPEKRLGMPGCEAGDVRNQKFFHLIDWAKAEKKELEPPFKPQLVSRMDVSNFDVDFISEPPVLTPIDNDVLKHVDQEQFDGFSFTNEEMFLNLSEV